MHAVPPPLAQRLDDRRWWPAVELAQARGEQREHQPRDAHPDEGPAPPVPLGDDAAEPDAEHAAERHADRVDPDREGAAASAVVLGDDRLRCGRVPRLTESDERAAGEQLPEVFDEAARG